MNPTEARIDQWRAAANAELQDLVQTAAAIRTNINNSKTSVKKQYFEKKFKKVQADVMRMLITLERLNAQAAVDGGQDDTTPTV
jgi:hypothetical protein